MSTINILIVSHEPLTKSLKELYCIEDLKKDFVVNFSLLGSIKIGYFTRMARITVSFREMKFFLSVGMYYTLPSQMI